MVTSDPVATWLGIVSIVMGLAGIVWLIGYWIDHPAATSIEKALYRASLMEVVPPNGKVSCRDCGEFTPIDDIDREGRCVICVEEDPA